MPDRTPAWLEPSPPWLAPVPPALCAGLAVAPDEIPVIEVLGAPCSVAEIIAVRAGRFIPIFGAGPTRLEAVRALCNIARALGRDADPRGPEQALAMVLHPGIATAPMRALAKGALDGSAELVWSEVVLAYVSVLGASDALREQVARELMGPRGISLELALAIGAGGGDFGTYREHYASLTSTTENDAVPVRVVRAWFDFVLARRFAGLDALHNLREHANLDPASRWLIATAELVAGGEGMRYRMAELAESLLGPLQTIAPRLLSIVAREMAEIVQHPVGLRYHHLRCAASRDHAAMAIRAWLSAATEADLDETVGTDLGPEPTRAARAAIEARAAAGEFLLDWFVPDREAREGVDAYARRVLRLYHRLRGAQLLARVERELRPPGGMLTGLERVIWGTLAER